MYGTKTKMKKTCLGIVSRGIICALILILNSDSLQLESEGEFQLLERQVDVKWSRKQQIAFVVAEIGKVTAEYDVILGEAGLIASKICQNYGGCSDNIQQTLVDTINSQKDRFRDSVYEITRNSILRQDMELKPQWLQHADATCIREYSIRATAAKQILDRNLTEPGGPSAFCASPGNYDLARSIGACPLAVARHAAGTEDWESLDADDWLRIATELFRAREAEAAKAALLVMVSLDQSPQRLLQADVNLALIFMSQGRTDLATQSYFRVLSNSDATDKILTAAEVKLAALIPPILLSTEQIVDFRLNWVDQVTELNNFYSSLLSQPAEARASGNLYMPSLPNPEIDIGWTTFHLSHQGENDIEFQVLLAELYSTLSPGLLYIAPHCQFIQSSAAHQKAGPVRVGFLSLYLHDHSIGRMMANLISGIAAEVPAIEVHTFTPYSDDSVYHFIAENSNQHHILTTVVSEARLQVASAELDVLVYCDIGLEPMTFFLAFARLAPIQMTWWGHPSTTALPHMDYFISLDTEVEDAALEHYTEQLIRMKSINIAPFSQQSKADQPEKTLDQLGLPANSTIYMALGRLFKVHPTFDQIIQDILNADAAAIVVLIAEKQADNLTSMLWHRLKSSIDNEGLLDRLLFVHHWNYVDVLAHASVVLDTYPYGGCLTSLEALSNSKVLVTLPSEFVRGRFSFSMYNQMGLDEFVAVDVQDYVNIALKIGGKSKGHANISDKVFNAYHKLQDNDESLTEWSQLFLKLSQHLV